MQACEGYVENGRFYPLGALSLTSMRLRAFLTVLDEPVRSPIAGSVSLRSSDSGQESIEGRLKEFSVIMDAINAAAGEEMPPLEPIRFREVEL
jgi:hypothetical protein